MLNLTKTESKYVHLLSLGLLEKEIADEMCVDPKTIHTHARNVRKKIGARNSVDVVRKYILSLEDPKKVLIGIFLLLLEIGSLGASYSGDDLRAMRSGKNGKNASVRMKTGRKINYADTFIV